MWAAFSGERLFAATWAGPTAELQEIFLAVSFLKLSVIESGVLLRSLCVRRGPTIVKRAVIWQVLLDTHAAKASFLLAWSRASASVIQRLASSITLSN